MHLRDKVQGYLVLALVIATPAILIWGTNTIKQKLTGWWIVVLFYFGVMSAVWYLVKFFDWRADQKKKRLSK